ncbi:MAG: hypothetical protein Q4F57_02500 [Weeksellaceae bacterium]|nr:hypothetical protein [Weeksellaceae bacterium]
MIDLQNRRTRWWMGFVLVASVSLFAWSLVQKVERNSREKISLLHMVNSNAKEQSRVARLKLDSASQERKLLTRQFEQLSAELDRNTQQILIFHSDYNQSKSKIDRNEKAHIPSVSADEQHDFLSTYTYRPYPLLHGSAGE